MIRENSNESRLIEEIIALSVSIIWAEAKREWDLAEIYREKEPLTCLCGHFPILEICVLSNRFNGNQAIVGNVCVNKFLGLESDLIFEGIKRISQDRTKGLNDAATIYAHQKRWINDWQKKFSLDTNKKQGLSSKQMIKRDEINVCVLAKTTNTFKDRVQR